MLDSATGLFQGAHFVASPNADGRPADQEPEVVVIHSISLPPGEFGGSGIEDLFCNRLDPSRHSYYQEIAGLKVSAHFLIRRDGELVQFVPTTQRAWHAGRACCEGRERVNDFSIGIELEGTNDQPFEDIQYEQLICLTRSLMAAYPAINWQRIYGHQDIAPGRKTDPGRGFDWGRLLGKLSAPAPDTLKKNSV